MPPVAFQNFWPYVVALTDYSLTFDIANIQSFSFAMPVIGSGRFSCFQFVLVRGLFEFVKSKKLKQ